MTMTYAKPQPFVWVGYDSSPARLPIAIASTSGELANKMGVTAGAVETTWSKYRHGKLKTTKYAMVFIDKEDDDAE